MREGRSPKWGLRLSDLGVAADELDATEKVVLAAMLSPYRRNESVEQFYDRLPLSRKQIEESRRSLQEKAVIRIACGDHR